MNKPITEFCNYCNKEYTTTRYTKMGIINIGASHDCKAQKAFYAKRLKSNPPTFNIDSLLRDLKNK